MPEKTITVTFYRQNHLRADWATDPSDPVYQRCIEELDKELSPFGIEVRRVNNDVWTIDVSSYADLLNAVRITSPADGFTLKCIGHIIGKSPDLNLVEDIRRAVNRVAFAPETVPPDDHNRKVCHNCGCGC